MERGEGGEDLDSRHSFGRTEERRPERKQGAQERKPTPTDREEKRA